MPVTAIALSSSLNEGGARGIHSSDVMEVDVNNQPTVVDVQTPDRSLNLHQNQTKSLLESEEAALRNEYESVILKKEKDLSATLQKLDEMKSEYSKNVQSVRERVMGERKEVETQLACEKGKSLALSEKLHDAVQLADRTLLAYNSQKELADARQEIIDNLRKEIEDGKQGYFHIPAVTLKTVGVMTSDCSSNKMENECQDLREKIIQITEHYDGKINLMNKDMGALKSKLESSNEELYDKTMEVNELREKFNTAYLQLKDYETKLGIDGSTAESNGVEGSAIAGDGSTPSSKNGVSECCEYIEVHATNGAITNGFLLWADIQRKQQPANTWKAEAEKRFLKDEITEAKEALWRVADEQTLGKMVNRKGTSKVSSEINDICSENPFGERYDSDVHLYKQYGCTHTNLPTKSR